MAEGKGREQQMIFYFDQLLRDYQARSGTWTGSYTRWRLFGDLSVERQMLNYSVALLLVLWFALATMFGAGAYPAVIMISSITLAGYVLTLVSLKNKEVDRRTGPGLIRKYHVPMADTVDRLYRVLVREGTEFDIFGITLIDWPMRPKATIFSEDGSDVLVTAWKDWNDPYYTVVHMGPYTITRKDHLDDLAQRFDASVP